nr:30S ribosomal protein S5 [Spiroplasma platyhelix]
MWIRRINKVTTGGRRLRFSAAVVVGNKKGTVGLGVAKANEVNDAIKKAIAAAHKNLKQVSINKDYSIYHHGMGTYCASKILLKPAKEGIGVKAGGSARDVVELAGIQNIYSKSLGSNNKINLARATINGLSSLKSAEFFQNKNIKRKTTPVTSVASSDVRK